MPVTESTANKAEDELTRLKRDFSQLQAEVMAESPPFQNELNELIRIGEMISRAEMQIFVARRRTENQKARQDERLDLRKRLNAVATKLDTISPRKEV